MGAGGQDRNGLIHRGQQCPQGQADLLTDRRPHQSLGTHTRQLHASHDVSPSSNRTFISFSTTLGKFSCISFHSPEHDLVMRQIQISGHPLLSCLGNRGSGTESGLRVHRDSLLPGAFHSLKGQLGRLWLATFTCGATPGVAPALGLHADRGLHPLCTRGTTALPGPLRV